VTQNNRLAGQDERAFRQGARSARLSVLVEHLLERGTTPGIGGFALTVLAEDLALWLALEFHQLLQHCGDRSVLGIGDLLEARIGLGVEADSHAQTGGGIDVRHAPYLHQSDAPFKGGANPQQERCMLTLDTAGTLAAARDLGAADWAAAELLLAIRIGIAAGTATRRKETGGSLGERIK